MALFFLMLEFSAFFSKFLINLIKMYSLSSDEKGWDTKNIPIFFLNKEQLVFLVCGKHIFFNPHNT